MPNAVLSSIQSPYPGFSGWKLRVHHVTQNMNENYMYCDILNTELKQQMPCAASVPRVSVCGLVQLSEHGAELSCWSLVLPAPGLTHVSMATSRDTNWPVAPINKEDQVKGETDWFALDQPVQINNGINPQTSLKYSLWLLPLSFKRWRWGVTGPQCTLGGAITPIVVALLLSHTVLLVPKGLLNWTEGMCGQVCQFCFGNWK